MPEPLLEVTALSLTRGAANLAPVSFTLPHAGCYWLTGVSGAGKSLLLESLAGFHAEASGTIRVNDREVATLAPEHRSIALMPQRWRLFPHWTVARNLGFAAKLGASPADRIEKLARRLQVNSLLPRAVAGLSGGETQRIALIQTLLSPATVLLLDEPLSAVDSALQSTVLDLLTEESATNRRICLIAAHRATTEYPMQGTLLLENGRLVSRPNRHG
jgi:ABC-type sugar transport system ATPase subunit